MTFDVSALLVAFLGGVAAATIAFMVSYSNKLTKLETKVGSMEDTLKEIKEAIHQVPCSAAQAIDKKVAVLRQRMDQQLQKEGS